ncbi:MAG: hypothetical protein MI741_17185, partial [Rhodospirillales bacterium]|nr:hypothetical protein [Rhodospirillales bacterium]
MKQNAVILFVLLPLFLRSAPAVAASPQEGDDTATAYTTLRAAITDLIETFGDRYPYGQEYLKRSLIVEATQDNEEFEKLRREALIANPLLSGQPILYVARHQYAGDHHSTATLFQTGEINANKFRGPGAIRLIDFSKAGEVTTLLDVPQGVARDPELSYDGKRIVFSMRRNRADDYRIYTINIDGSDLRQLTTGSGVADIDPDFLPDGTIVFAGSRDHKFCQCNRHIMCNLYRMDADGDNVHQIGGSGLFEGHPHVMPDGRILYDRWEYVDRQFGPSFGLWTVNPDGTNPALFYGNNAWSPGMIADARMIPGTQNFIATYGSCHDRPWGAIAMVDRTRGFDGPEP